MWALINNIFIFIVEKGKILFLIVSIAVLIEGLLYILFPEKIKRVVQDCPSSLFRAIGALIALIGAILILLYIRILNIIL